MRSRYLARNPHVLNNGSATGWDVAIAVHSSAQQAGRFPRVTLAGIIASLQSENLANMLSLADVVWRSALLTQPLVKILHSH